MFLTQLAKEFHPDSNKASTAKEKFLDIQEAYEVQPVLNNFQDPFG